MIPLKVRRYRQIRRRNAMLSLVSLCALALVPAGYGQTDRMSQLISQLKDNRPEVRWTAAGELGDIKDPRAVEPLIAALKDSDCIVRWNAADALGIIKDPRAVEPLIAALKDSDSMVRWNAVRALVKIGTPAVEPLIAALKDSDSTVRSGAADALGHIKDPRAVVPPAILTSLGGTLHRLGRLGLPGDFLVYLDAIDGTGPEFGSKFKVAIAAGQHSLSVSMRGYNNYNPNSWSSSDPMNVSFVAESGHTYAVKCYVDRKKYSQTKDYWIPLVFDVTDKAHQQIVSPPKAAQ